MKGLKRVCARVGLSVFLFASLAQAGGPPSGLYENSTESPLIELLDSAQKMIDIEIYSMGNPLVQKAILNAQKAGVQVRIIQEPTPIGEPCRIFDERKDTQAKDCEELVAFRKKVIANGGTYLPFSKRLCGGGTAACVQHGKMVIVDAKVALLSTGNFNSTNLCDKREHPQNCNRDYSYILRHGPAIQVLGMIFERDLDGVPYNLEPILAKAGAADLTVSPSSIRPIVQFIQSAKKTLELQEQYLRDPDMNDAILDAAKRGVDVRIMVSSACFFGKPTPAEATKWKATYSGFERAGAKIRAFTRHIDVDGVPGYLHAKAIVVDGTTAWVGSVNGSTQSFRSNREFGLFFDNPADVKNMLHFMRADFKNPAAESWQDSVVCANDLI